MDRLQLLIFSFYREDPHTISLLQPLLACKMVRSWGSIRVECKDARHLAEVRDLVRYLMEPIAALGLANRVILRAPGLIQRTFPLDISLNTHFY